MPLIPTILFYVATVALVIVCAFLLVLIFYLIRAARVAASLARFLETEGRRISRGLSGLRRVAALALALFD